MTGETDIWASSSKKAFLPEHMVVTTDWRTVIKLTKYYIMLNMQRFCDSSEYIWFFLKDLHFTFLGYWFSLLYGVIIHLVWAFGMVRRYGMGFSYHNTYQTTVPYQVLQYALCKCLSLKENSLFRGQMGVPSKCNKYIVIRKKIRRPRSLSHPFALKVNEKHCLCERFHIQKCMRFLMV